MVELAQGTNVFKPHEIVSLREVLDDYHAATHQQGHESVTFESDGAIIGFAYFAPAEMTDRTWYLWWIAVDKRLQAKGIGAQLLTYTEQEVRRAGGRLYLIETSSLPQYEPTRRFYLKHGYEQHALIADFYADGDSMVVFRKQL